MNPQNTHTELLTVTQAAEQLAIKPRTLYRLIARKQFPRPLKIGRASRVSTADVNQFLADLVSTRAAESTA